MTAPTTLAILNAHPRDANILFEEEGHIYTILGERGTYLSCTTFVHEQFPKFNAESIIKKMLARGVDKQPESPYFGMTSEAIQASWKKKGDDACQMGTKMHFDIECHENVSAPENGDSNGDSDRHLFAYLENTSIEFGYFLNFKKDFPHLKPFRTEWTVYDVEHKICGSIDMVYLNTETVPPTYEIYDWKRSKEIVFDSPFAKPALPKCLSQIFVDTNYWHYSLQLNIYKKILESHYGIKITKMFLLCLHSNYSNYERIEVDDHSPQIQELFNDRLDHVQNLQNLLES
jgi:hypothetical protein